MSDDQKVCAICRKRPAVESPDKASMVCEECRRQDDTDKLKIGERQFNEQIREG